MCASACLKHFGVPQDGPNICDHQHNPVLSSPAKSGDCTQILLTHLHTYLLTHLHTHFCCAHVVVSRQSLSCSWNDLRNCCYSISNKDWAMGWLTRLSLSVVSAPRETRSLTMPAQPSSAAFINIVSPCQHKALLWDTKIHWTHWPWAFVSTFRKQHDERATGTVRLLWIICLADCYGSYALLMCQYGVAHMQPKPHDIQKTHSKPSSTILTCHIVAKPFKVHTGLL